MKLIQFKRMVLMVVISIGLTGSTFAEIILAENFSGGPNDYYTGSHTYTSTNIWELTNIKAELAANSFGEIGGAARFEGGESASLITPEINSIGTITFQYRELNALAADTETFTVSKSINGGTFTTIGTPSFNGTTYSTFSVVVNDLSNNIRIKISSNSSTYLIIDEMEISNYTLGPSLNASPSILTGFSYTNGNGPSDSKIYNLSGTNLTGATDSIVITAPTNYEVSLDDITFAITVNVPYTSATLASTPIHVRLKAGLAVSAYNSALITNVGGGANSISVTCNGSVSAAPYLNVSPLTLSGFSYMQGSGPSTSQSYNLSGGALTEYPSNILVEAPTNYEVSLDNLTFSESLNVEYLTAYLFSTPIYVRLKEELPTGLYNTELIAQSVTGAITLNVTCSGEVTPPPSPQLLLSESSLTGFSYELGSGPSDQQSYNLSGASLTGYPSDIIVSAPENYEISLTAGTAFTSSLSVPYSSATLASTPIYVRLKSDLSVGTYNSEIVANSGGGATTVNVICNGSVTEIPPASLNVSSEILSDFNYIVGSGPSTEQSYNLSGTYLTGYPDNIVVTAPSNYEVSLSANSGYGASIDIAYSSATLSSTPIYVRLKADLIVGGYDSEIIANVGGGANTLNVICNGSVSDMPPPILSVNTSTLNDFNYIVGSGPSAQQSLTISGSNLDNSSVSITPPTNYEISFTSGSEFTSSALSLPSYDGSATNVYVRLIAGLSVATYDSEVIVISGGGATTVNVTCSGSVSDVPPPTLYASTTDISGFNYFVGSGPSSVQSYNLSGTYLTGYPDDIIVTAPSNYEVSLSASSGFEASIDIAYSSETLSSTLIYVRLKADLLVGTYNSEYITNSGGGATDVDVICNGTVSEISTDPCLAEDFSGFTTGTHASPNSSDVSSSLDSYTQTTGWAGYKIFSAGGEIKLGSSSAAGYIITPTIDLSAGGTVEFDYAKYGSDNGSMQIFHAADGVNFNQVGSNTTPTTDYQMYSVEITDGTALSKIKIGSSTKRIYVDNVEIYCGGSVPTPMLVANPIFLNGFSYIEGSGPSAEQSFVFSGTDLDGTNVSIEPSTNYEISLNSDTGFQSSNIELPSYNGSSTIVYVRLKSGLGFGTYNSEIITISGGGANEISITCSGTIDELATPILTVSPTTLTGFNYTEGSGPSAEQEVSLTGSDLDALDVIITPSTNYEVSLTSGTGFQSTPVNIGTFDGNALSIYIRLKSGLIANDYNSEIISISGGGADEISITCSGTVDELITPELFVNPEILDGFTYMFGHGPSSEQSFNLSGNGLNNNQLTITPPTDYEISLTSSTGFQTSPIIFNSFDGNETTVFVRLKSDLAVGDYNNEEILISGSGAVDVSVTCNGTVDENVSVNLLALYEKCSIYPNPTQDLINIDIENWDSEYVKIEILDLMGRLVFAKELNVNNCIANDRIDFSQYNSGLYYIRLSNKDTTINRQIIKK